MVSLSWVAVVKRASERSNIPQEMLATAYKVISEEILLILEAGNSVSLQKFGRFEVKARGGKFDIKKVAPHTKDEGADPSTATTEVKPMNYIKFTPALVASWPVLGE